MVNFTSDEISWWIYTLKVSKDTKMSLKCEHVLTPSAKHLLNLIFKQLPIEKL